MSEYQVVIMVIIIMVS